MARQSVQGMQIVVAQKKEKNREAAVPDTNKFAGKKCMESEKKASTVLSRLKRENEL